MRREVITQLEVSAVLLKTETRTVVVATAILSGNNAVKPTLPDAVGELSLERAVRAGAETDVGLHAVLTHLARHDVDHTAHGVGAVEHRGGAAQHLHPLGHHRLVRVAYGVAEDALVLRMAVDEHHHAARRAAKSAQADAPGGTVAHGVTHHGARRYEQSGHLLGKSGQHVCAPVLG